MGLFNKASMILLAGRHARTRVCVCACARKVGCKEVAERQDREHSEGTGEKEGLPPYDNYF